MNPLLRLCLLLGCVLATVVTASAQGSANDTLIVSVASPGEGETFYAAAEGPRLSVPIAGQVISYGSPLHPETVDLTLTLVDHAGGRTELSAPLDDTGSFEVWVSILSTNLPWPSDDPHVEEICGQCHRATAALAMPPQVSEVIIEAHAADGRTGQATRHLRVDRGSMQDLVVQVEGLPAGTTIAQVTAATRIYDWRRRAFHTNLSNGAAILPVEGLTYADLSYEVALLPLVIDGTRYTAEAQTVIVPGSAEILPEVTLVAVGERSTVNGRVVFGADTQGVAAAVLAVNLETGAAQRTATAADGTFTFEDLSIAQYSLLASAPGGFHLPQHLDLTQTALGETRIHLIPAGEATLHGTVTVDGAPAPFVEVTTTDLPVAYGDPLSGAFTLPGVDLAQPASLSVAAAGCYGLPLDADAEGLGTIALALRPDTAVIDQAGSRLYLPAETAYTQQDDGIVQLQRGVLWARGLAQSGDVLRVQAGDYLLASQGASFAIEQVGGATPRLYVSVGTVQVTHPAAAEPLVVEAGQTLTLAAAPLRPAGLVEGAGPLLRADGRSVAHFVLAPTPAEQASATLFDVSVVLARGAMLLAYAITFLGVPLVIIGAAVFYFRRRPRS